jgi:hypothetical protein
MPTPTSSEMMPSIPDQTPLEADGADCEGIEDGKSFFSTNFGVGTACTVLLDAAAGF